MRESFHVSRLTTRDMQPTIVHSVDYPVAGLDSLKKSTTIRFIYKYVSPFSKKKFKKYPYT